MVTVIDKCNALVLISRRSNTTTIWTTVNTRDNYMIIIIFKISQEWKLEKLEYLHMKEMLKFNNSLKC